MLDHEITAEEANTIVELANIGTGLTDSQKRTVEYCMYTFNASDEAEAVFNAAMTQDAARAAEKLAEKVEVISKAAETETPVTEEATATEVTPSQTLMVAYNEYKNADGRITMHSADEFIAAIFKDHKYTKNEQGQCVCFVTKVYSLQLQIVRFLQNSSFHRKEELCIRIAIY